MENRRQQANIRHEEIDVLRATALVLMILFHLVYDLQVFAGIAIDHKATLWHFVGKTSALLFIFISGLANGFSKSPFKRGLKVLLCGMLVTVATYLFIPEEYVRFGILHFLGLTMLLYPLLNKLPSPLLLVLAVLSVIIGSWFKGQLLTTNLLLPLGLMYYGFTTIDYYPLFPYITATILGMLTYRQLYANHTKPFFSSFRLSFGLTRRLSKNSLLIYLVHQPLLLLIILGIQHL